jgi:hypothetical protein
MSQEKDPRTPWELEQEAKFQEKSEFTIKNDTIKDLDGSKEKLVDETIKRQQIKDKQK